MIHLNKIIIEQGKFGLGYVTELFLPEIYEAVTIRDFLDNEDKIKTTSPWKPSNLIHEFLVWRALIYFNNVILTREKDLTYVMRDVNDEISIETWKHKEQPEDGKYYDVIIEYCPETKRTKEKIMMLWFADKFGPPKEQREKQKKPRLERILSGNLCPSPA